MYNLTHCGLGMDDAAELMIKDIFPNPSNDQMTAQYDQGIQLKEVILVDLSGRTVDSYETNSTIVTINKNDLKAGVYLLKSTTVDGIVSTSKIVFE